MSSPKTVHKEKSNIVQAVDSQIYICVSACGQGAGNPACKNFVDEITEFNNNVNIPLPLPERLPVGMERTISNIEARFIGKSIDHLKELVQEEMRFDLEVNPNRTSDHVLLPVLTAAENFASTIHQAPNEGADQETGFIDTGRHFPHRYDR